MGKGLERDLLERAGGGGGDHVEPTQDRIPPQVLEGTSNFTPFSRLRALSRSDQWPAGISGTRWT